MIVIGDGAILEHCIRAGAIRGQLLSGMWPVRETLARRIPMALRYAHGHTRDPCSTVQFNEISCDKRHCFDLA